MVGAIVLAYVVRDGGFHTEYSISRYVGREAWSAVIFALGNLVIAWQIYRYVRLAWEDYGKVWLMLARLMLVGFVGLSFCPLGLFDEVYGNYGAVSVMHQIFSRGMFVMMAAMTFVKGMKEYAAGRRTVAWTCMAFVVVAAGLAAMSFNPASVFWMLNFVIESSYICLFMMMLMV